MGFWQKLFSRKQSAARTALVMNQVGRAVPTTRNYEAFAKEGYQVNVIAYKCVSVLSRSCAAIEWNLFQKRTGMTEKIEIETHPVLDLLKQPNPMQGGSSFFEAIVGYYLIAGNSYIEAVGPSERSVPLELWPVRPDKMRIIPGAKGMPQAFEFNSVTKKILFPVDQVTGESQILHMKTFHPTDNWYGMSPIEAAMYSVDQHNESGVWNLSLLQNMATPSGVVSVKQDPTNPLGTIPDVQFNNVREQLKAKLEGSQNAGRILLLEGGMDWKQMGLTPKDMDWMEGRKMSARDIALAFGVPPIILNIPGDSTFNNYREARLSMYEDTIIPIMDFIRDELNKWLVQRFGDNLYLDYDVDSIPALEAKRSEKFTMVSSSGFLTINEKRASVGYEPIDGGDILLVPSGQIPLTDATLPLEEPEPEPEEDMEDAEGTEEEDTEDSENSDENLGDDDEDSVEDGVETASHVPDLIEVKQINPFGKRGRLQVWKSVNREREILSRAMALDLKEAFDDMAQAVEKAVQGVDPKVAEFPALKAIADFSPKLREIVLKHFKRSIRVFGEPILQSGKTLLPEGMEQKTRNRFLDFQTRFAETHAAEAIEFIEGTNIKRARAKIKKMAASELQEPGNFPQELRKEFESLSSYRANTIARTEIGIASNEGALEAARALDLPQMMKEWVSVQDNRTRPGNFDGGNLDEANHIVMNGVKIPIDEKFTVPPDASMDGPQEPGAPAEQVINCFVPGAEVSGYFIAGTRSEYVGDVFEIQTKSGAVVTVTPNHPVFTEKGLVAAHELCQGMNLLCQNRSAKTLVQNSNVEQEPTFIENVFHSLQIRGNSLRTNLSVDDFHGDAKFIRGNVDIVMSDWKLLLKRIVDSKQFSEDFILKLKHPALFSESTLSSFDFSFSGIDRPSSGNPSSFDLSFDESGTFLNQSPFGGFGFGLSSELNSVLLKLSLNHSSIKAQGLGNLIDGHSTSVSFDPIINIRKRNYFGHVYDLQSNSGLMIANGVITSNCRCVLVFSRG